MFKFQEAFSKVIFSHTEFDSGSVKILNPNLLDSDPDIYQNRMTDVFDFCDNLYFLKPYNTLKL
jgi:hypothetical protein